MPAGTRRFGDRSRTAVPPGSNRAAITSKGFIPVEITLKIGERGDRFSKPYEPMVQLIAASFAGLSKNLSAPLEPEQAPECTEYGLRSN
jgi:hypothetical protein